jgi:hypothetical protein
VWLAIVMIWGNVLFAILAVSFFTGSHLTRDLEGVVTFCLVFFTLPATASYLACAGLAWLMPRAWRAVARRAGVIRARVRPASGHPVHPAASV